MVSRKRLVVIVAALVILAPFAVVIALVPLSMTPRESELEILNADGVAGEALVVYHPGITSFHVDVTLAFVDGLISNDWRVEITTASRLAPANLSGYDLLVLGGPGYGNEPAVPITDYVTRVGNLGGIKVVLIVTAAANGADAIAILGALVQNANATVISTMLLYLMAPNQDSYGNTDALEIATRAGSDIPLP